MENQENTATKVDNPLVEKKFIRGDYGLGFTFWGAGFGGTFILISFITSILNVVGNETVAFFFLGLFFVYAMIIAIATWRSSNQYTGPAHWATFTKIAVILSTALVLIIYLYLLAYLTADYPNH